MKKAKMFFTIGISLLLLVSVAILINNNIIAHASNTPPQKLIVNGSCENYFTPDTAYITMGVLEATENSTESAERTLEYVPTNLEVTLDTLKSNGIKTEDIYTRELNMPFDMFNNMRSQTISNVVEFKTNNIDNLDLLIEQLQKDNIGSVKCIRYALEDTNSSYGNVLNCAVNNAVEKVKAMYGNHTYNIVEVIEEGCFSPQCFSRCFANNTNSNDILLCGNVKVVFELDSLKLNSSTEQNTTNAVILPNQEVLNQNTDLNTTEPKLESENSEMVEDEVVESEENNIDTEDNETLDAETMEDTIAE